VMESTKIAPLIYEQSMLENRDPKLLKKLPLKSNLRSDKHTSKESI
jgi:hypothetical protein